MKKFLLKTWLLLACLLLGVGTSWAEDTTGTITFGTNDVKINAASVTGDDDLGNTWTITTEGTTSFTTNAAYYQVGSSNNPAKSITFTTTLSESSTIKSMSAKFGGFTSTAGTVTLKVGSTTVGTGRLNGTSDVTVNSTSSATGTTLTVTVTGIAKGVKVYNISYTIQGDETSDPVDASWTIDSNVSLKEGRTKNLTLTTNYDGELIAASENDVIATASYDDETKVLSITGVSAGSTRIGFLGDETSSYKAIEKYVNVTVLAPGVITIGKTTVALNNELFGTNYTSANTSCSKNGLDLVGEESGISVEVKNGESLSMYVTDELIRIYNGYTMEVSVPTGYVITEITFNEPSSSTRWDANPTPSVGEFTTDTKTWTGSVDDIKFTFTAQCRMVSMDVTVAAVPAVTYTEETLEFVANDGSSYWATFSNSKDVFIDEDVMPFVVTVSGSSLIMNDDAFEADDIEIEGTPVSGYWIPANTGVLLQSSSDEVFYWTVENANISAITAQNNLYPASKDKAELANHKFYMLAYGDAEFTPSTLGFYWGAADGVAFTSREGGAYLAVPASASLARGFSFSDGTEALESIEMNAATTIYTLSGVKVNELQKGLNIVNGKKVMVK